MTTGDEFPMITRWCEEVCFHQGHISDLSDYVSIQGPSAHGGQNQGAVTVERALIQAAQRGDLEAFNRLVIVYQDKVYTHAYYLLGDRMAADDAVQEAFISAYRSLQSYRGDSFRVWLFRIVKNKCLDELRRRKRHPAAPFHPNAYDGREIESPYFAVDPGESPEDSLLKSELSRQIQSCLERLTGEKRTVLVLVDLLGMTYEEAAQATGCRLGTVKSRLARARAQMRSYLQESPLVNTYEFFREPSGTSKGSIDD